METLRKLKITRARSNENDIRPSESEEDASNPLLNSEISDDERAKLLDHLSSSRAKNEGSIEDLVKLRKTLAPSVGKMFANQTWKQIKNGKLNYCLGCSSVFLVVMVVAILISVLNNTPMFFLRIAERTQGEIDASIWMSGDFPRPTMNYTLISSILDGLNSDLYRYHSPRTDIGDASVYASQSCYQVSNSTSADLNYNVLQDSGEYSCSNGWSSNLFIIDSEKEAAMGLGRDWSLPALGKGEVYINSALASSIGVSAGQNIIINTDGRNLFGRFWDDVSKGNSEVVFITMNVKGVFSDSGGKYGSSVTRAVIAEYKSFFSTVIDDVWYLTADEKAEFSKINPYDYAMEMSLNLPPDVRMDYYVNSDFDSIQTVVTHTMSTVGYAIGFPYINFALPILYSLRIYSYVSLFLGVIVNVIIFILLFISAVLIYSLLITNVEQRSFEIGILRMFGLLRVQTVGLLLTQSLSFTLVSYPLGMITAQIMLVVLFNKLGSIVSIEISPIIKWNAALLSAALGILVPALASIVPIRNALGTNLQDALDTRRPIKTIKVHIDRSEDGLSFSYGTLTIGICMAIFGVAIYYFLPLALISLNLTLLLNIFTGLLVGMLLGLTMLSLNFQYILERILVITLFFWDHASKRSVVLKNLVAHRERNMKTTLLFAVSLGFIVFINVSYSIQESSFLYQIQQRNGALMNVHVGLAKTGSGYISISETNVAQLEELVKTENDTIKNYAWVSQPLASLYRMASTRASNLGHVYKDFISVYTVSPNYFDVALPGFLNIDEGPDDLLRNLYSPKGSHSIIMGSVYEKNMGLSADDTFLVTVATGDVPEDGSTVRINIFGLATSKAAEQTYVKALTPLAFLDSAPGFKFSQFPQVKSQDAIVSMPTYVRMSPVIDSVDRIPLRVFIIQFQDGVSDSEKDRIRKKLDSAIGGGDGATTWDYRSDTDTITTASTILDYFFTFTTVIAMLVCFFSLNSSMFNSIYSQSREIAILRAVGVSNLWLYSIYIYEAIVIVLSSSFLGIIIGATVGYTMVIQRVLFTQLPLPFVFPWGIVIAVCAGSIIFGFLSSFGPIRFLLRLSIVELMRYHS